MLYLPVLYGCETLSLKLREENRTRTSEQNLNPRKEVIVGLISFKMENIVICTFHDIGLLLGCLFTSRAME